MRPPSVLGDAEETVGSPWLFLEAEQSPPDPAAPPASTGEEPTP